MLKSLYISALLLILSIGTFEASAQCQADFTADVTCDSVAFMDSSTWKGTRASAFWHFGDGTNSQQPNPVKVYQRAGNYQVTMVLTVYDTFQRVLCLDSITKTISISTPCCEPDFTYSIDTATRTVSFEASTRNFVNNVWFFGDGKRANDTNNVSHTYADSGSFDVTHRVYTLVNNQQYVCESTVRIFVPREAESCRSDWSFNVRGNDVDFAATFNGGTRYFWMFGDGDTGTGRNVRHSFKLSKPDEAEVFNICLVVEDSTISCTTTTCMAVRIDPINCGLTADFTYSIDTMRAKVNFVPSTQVPGTEHLWIFEQFGDTLTENTATYTFYGAGRFDVTHIVLIRDSSKKIICGDTLLYEPINIPRDPVCFAQFKVAVDTNEKYKLYIVNQSVGQNLEYLWDMGDGTQYDIKEPSHHYDSFGRYLVTLSIQVGICKSSVQHFLGMDAEGRLLKKDGFDVQVIDRGVIGVERANLEKALVYPNPFSNEIQILIQGLMPDVNDLDIYGLDGARIQVTKTIQDNGEISIDGSHLKSGIYILRIRSKNGWIQRRVIKI